MREIQSCVDDGDAYTGSCPVQSAWRCADPLDARRYDLRARGRARRGYLCGVGICRLSIHVEGSDTIGIRRLSLKPEVADGSDAGGNLPDLSKAAAGRCRARAPFDLETFLVVGIIEPAQLDEVGGDRCCAESTRRRRRRWRGRWRRCWCGRLCGIRIG